MTDWYEITERIKKFNDILNEVGGSLWLGKVEGRKLYIGITDAGAWILEQSGKSAKNITKTQA